MIQALLVQWDNIVSDLKLLITASIKTEYSRICRTLTTSENTNIIIMLLLKMNKIFQQVANDDNVLTTTKNEEAADQCDYHDQLQSNIVVDKKSLV